MAVTLDNLSIKVDNQGPYETAKTFEFARDW